MKSLLKWLGMAIVLVVLGAGLVFYLHPLWVSDERIRFALWRAGVQSEYVEVGGYKLHYLEASPPHGGPERPLLLIHGLGSRAEDWSPLIPGLAAAGFHVYVPDLLGYGRSPQPDVDYSMTLQEKIVAQFMDARHLGKADVGGWSMGGWIAMKLAAEHPERVNRLILYDSAGTYFAASFDENLFSPHDVAGLDRLMAAISPHPKPLPSFAARDALRKLGRNAWVVQRSMTSMRAGQDLMDFRLRQIKEPTLIVWGTHDDLIPPEVGERIHKGIAGSEMVLIDGCGHLAPAECWRPVEKVTLDFLTNGPENGAPGSIRTVPGMH